MVLLADDNIQSRVSLSELVQRSIIGKGWADENDVIKLATEKDTALVHHKLRLARLSQPHNECIEWNVARIHFNSAQILTVFAVCLTESLR